MVAFPTVHTPTSICRPKPLTAPLARPRVASCSAEDSLGNSHRGLPHAGRTPFDGLGQTVTYDTWSMAEVCEDQPCTHSTEKGAIGETAGRLRRPSGIADLPTGCCRFVVQMRGQWPSRVLGPTLSASKTKLCGKGRQGSTARSVCQVSVGYGQTSGVGRRRSGPGQWRRRARPAGSQ